MARSARALVIVCFATVLCSAAEPSLIRPGSWHEPGGPLILADAYGDTVWFNSRNVSEGSIQYLTPGGPRTTPMLKFVTPWAATAATPLVVVTHWREPIAPARAVVESVCSQPQLRVRSVFPDGDRQPTVYEPGCFGPNSHPSACGWDLHCAAAETSAVRMIFFVCGKPDTLSGRDPLRLPGHESWGRDRGASDPVPVMTDRYRRFHELTPADLLATFRIVGDVRVDLGNRMIEQADSARAVKR